MTQKRYSKKEKGVDLEKASKDSTNGKRVYIPELRMTVFTLLDETFEETKQRYMSKSLTYGKKVGETSNVVIEDVD